MARYCAIVSGEFNSSDSNILPLSRVSQQQKWRYLAIKQLTKLRNLQRASQRFLGKSFVHHRVRVQGKTNCDKSHYGPQNRIYFCVKTVFWKLIYVTFSKVTGTKKSHFSFSWGKYSVIPKSFSRSSHHVLEFTFTRSTRDEFSCISTTFSFHNENNTCILELFCNLYQLRAWNTYSLIRIWAGPIQIGKLMKKN